MKKFFSIAAISSVLLIAAACNEKAAPNGSDIRFTATIGAETKVTYSGVKESGRERVDWTDGDMVWIWSPECTIPASHEAYYVIRDVQADGYYSKAGIYLYSTDGTATSLKWNESVTEHHLFAIYPTPLVNNSVYFRLFMSTTPATARYGAAVPAVQAPLEVSTVSGGKVAQPDGKNLIMIASGVYPTRGTVNLEFNPVVTAVEFTIKNGYADKTDMTLHSVKLTSANDAIYGKFSAVYGESTATFEDTGREIEIPFSTPVTVAYDETFRFTVFMLGKESASSPDISNIDIEFVTGATTSIKARLATSEGVMAFPRAKKSYVTGLIVPGACVWTLSAVPDAVTAWGTEDLTVEIQ